MNDRRMHGGQEPDGQPPLPEDVRAALPQSELSWGYKRDQPGERCFLHINNVPRTVQYELLTDTHYVSPAHMEACLRKAPTYRSECGKRRQGVGVLGGAGPLVVGGGAFESGLVDTPISSRHECAEEGLAIINPRPTLTPSA